MWLHVWLRKTYQQERQYIVVVSGQFGHVLIPVRYSGQRLMRLYATVEDIIY